MSQMFCPGMPFWLENLVSHAGVLLSGCQRHVVALGFHDPTSPFVISDDCVSRKKNSTGALKTADKLISESLFSPQVCPCFCLTYLQRVVPTVPHPGTAFDMQAA